MRRGRTIGFTLFTLLAACATSTPAPVEVVAVPPPTAAPLVSTPEPPASSAAPEAPPPLQVRQVNAGWALEPRDPAPARPEMPGEAALVWEVIPAPPNRSGPIERDTTITRFVVQKDGRAEIVAQRDEAVFSSGASLWHLTSRDVPVVVEDCTDPGKRVRRIRKQLVFESLEKKPRRVTPMEGHVELGEWARLDLEAMVGPWVSMTIDHESHECGGRPLGSASRVVVDLDRAQPRKFELPKGALERYQTMVHDVIAGQCGGGDEIQADQAGFHYDQQGNLVVEYGFRAFTASSCFHGIAHVFVGTYDLLPELASQGRLPAWLRAYLKEHPSRSVSVIPIGREVAARKEFERLPRIAPRLPRDSGSD
jgi:hypothetical protein